MLVQLGCEAGNAGRYKIAGTVPANITAEIGASYATALHSNLGCPRPTLSHPPYL